MVRNNQGQIELIANICRHRQAIMLKDRGNFKTPGQGHAGSNPHSGELVACDDLKWEFSKAYSMQTVGVAPTFGKPALASTKSATRFY